ncbi:MAG: hypothetical protein R2685_02805 [Candidatus Nitrosocosmicus sp.]|jgi:hypothetical protein|nr:hypothetical protein [Candidatus Nitrosocosmicus sp.]
MKIIVIPNLLFQCIKLEELNEDGESSRGNGRRRMDCMKCGFEMGEYIVGNLKCFKCGSELD